MIQDELNDFSEFERKVEDIRSRYPEARFPLLFRGQRESSWRLQTTLERVIAREQIYTTPTFHPRSVDAYYRLISRVEPEVETFTGQRWDGISMRNVMDLHLSDHQPFHDAVVSGEIPAYEYLIYLRHMGFPSPLLDWTSSPYVAAFFAFEDPSESDPAIFAYLDVPEKFRLESSDKPFIRRCGPYSRGHRRHFAQQSTYTLCLTYDGYWQFAQIEDVLSPEDPWATLLQQDVVWKFVIPRAERRSVLRRLAQYNINAGALFGSEESVLKAIASREFSLLS